MKFCPAEPEDAGQIAEVFRTVYKDIFPYTNPEEIEPDLHKNDIFSLVVEEEQEIVGFVQLRPPDYSFCDGDRAVEIARLALKPSYQGQGWGTKLIETLQDKITARKPNYVFADLQTANYKSQKLFANFGLQPVCFLSGLVPDFIDSNLNLSIMVSMKLREEIKTSLDVYLPKGYGELADFIYNNFTLKRKIKNQSRKREVKPQFKEKVAKHLEQAREMEQEDNYNYDFVSLEITVETAVDKIKYAEKKGLKVEGIIPNVVKEGAVKDILVMRKRPKQMNYSQIALLEGANQQLFNLVK